MLCVMVLIVGPPRISGVAPCVYALNYDRHNGDLRQEVANHPRVEVAGLGSYGVSDLLTFWRSRCRWSSSTEKLPVS